MDLSDFLGDQAVLDRPHAVGGGLLVAEGHRPKPEQAAAGLAHTVDLLVEPPGGEHGAELTSRVDHHRSTCHHRAADPRHEGAGLGAISPDPDGVQIACDTRVTHKDIIAPGCGAELSRGVNEHSGTRSHRLATNPRHEGAGLGAISDPDGGRFGCDTRVAYIDVTAPVCQRTTGVGANGNVAASVDVVDERTLPEGGVVGACVVDL